MKHILQWKIIGIMFISLLCAVTAMATGEYLFFAKLQGLTPEQAEQMSAGYSYLFDILFIAVLITVFLILSRKIIKRIEVMDHNVEQIAEGKLTELVADRKLDELGSLSRKINDMAQRIANATEKEREMVCSVAHDLRTPVTSIQGYAGLLEKSPELSETNLKYVSIIKNKSADLSEQIEELLEYSIVQFEEKTYEFEELSLRRLIEQVLIEYVPMLEQSNMKFSMKGIENEMMLSCNQLLMVRLFENLFTNCIRYGNKGGKIEIELAEDGEKEIICISNYGSLLTEEERAHIFDAFYQGQDAVNYKTKSKGLGLAIVRKIVQLHEGIIEVLCETDTGKLTFRIVFETKNRKKKVRCADSR